jgi:hypothetical protein
MQRNLLLVIRLQRQRVCWARFLPGCSFTASCRTGRRRWCVLGGGGLSVFGGGVILQQWVLGRMAAAVVRSMVVPVYERRPQGVSGARKH